MSNYEKFSLLLATIYDVLTAGILVIGFIQYNSHWRNTIKVNTFKYLDDYFQSKDGVNASSDLISILNHTKRKDMYLLYNSDIDNPELYSKKIIVMAALNKMEHLSVAMSCASECIVDYDTFKLLYSEYAKRLWGHCDKFIIHARSNGEGEKYMEFFEALVVRINNDEKTALHN